jgi:hypothetical protein
MKRWLLVALALALLATMAALPASAQTPPGPPTAHVPPPPEQLKPLLPVLGPSAAPACGTAGLAGVALAGYANGLIYSALTPVFEVCGYLPPATDPATCPADAPIDQAARAVAPGAAPLLPLPTPAATTIDTVNAMNQLVEANTGQPLPPEAIAVLFGASGCTVGSPAPAPDDGGGPQSLIPPSVPAPPVFPGEAAIPVANVAANSFLGVPAAASAAPTPASTSGSRPAAARYPRSGDDWTARLLTALGLLVVLTPLVLRSGQTRRPSRA